MANNNWKDKKEDARNLYLDFKNPRIPKKNRNNETSVLEYLLEYENVLEIAKNIAKEGYHHSAISIVCEENGKKIVLDGNRRLAACKLLLNPKLSLKKNHIKIFESLQSSISKDDFKNIKITIAPNRDSAEKEIWDIHLSSLMKKWQVIQKLRKYKELVKNSSIKKVALEYRVSEKYLLKELARLSFYEIISEKLITKDEQEKLLKPGFNKIERILVPDIGENFLGYKKNNSTGEIIVENQEKFKKNLDKIQNDILTNSELKAACIKKEIEDRFVAVDKSYSRITNGDKNSPNPNQSDLFGNKNSNLGTEKNSLENKKPGTTAKPDWIISDDYKEFDKDSVRAKEMLKEMKSMVPENNPNILVSSLRVLLELALYHKLKETRHIEILVKNYKKEIQEKNKELIRKKEKAEIQEKNNWSPSFRKMLDYIIEEKNRVIIDPKLRTSLEKVIKGDKDLVADLNEFIHNPSFVPSRDEPKKIWRKFGRLLLFDIILKIKKVKSKK